MTPKLTGKVSDQLGSHCPECEEPNQFGDVCEGCMPEVSRQEWVDRDDE